MSLINLKYLENANKTSIVYIWQKENLLKNVQISDNSKLSYYILWC